MKKLPFSFSIYCCFLYFLLQPPTTIADINSDKAALLDFAASLPHARRLNWKIFSSVCKSWSGVTCTPDGARVMALHLPAFGLTGPIPENTLSRLDGLETLSLRLKNLNGSLPSDILSLDSLRYISLQQNNFSGYIPSSFSSGLSAIDFSFNWLTGEIPGNVQNLRNLTALYLQNNSLSGPIPDLDLPNLKQLNLSNNVNLNGPIPSHLRTYPSDSFAGNSMLCGEPLDDCPSPSPSPPYQYRDFFPQSPSPVPSPSLPITPQMITRDNKKNISTRTIVVIVVVGAILLVAVVLSTLGWFFKQKKTFKIQLLKGNLIQPETPKKDFSSGVQEAKKNKLIFHQSSSYSFNLEDLLTASAEILGQGSYGTTFAAILEKGTKVVVKRLGEVVAGKKEFEQQMNIIGRLTTDHPNIVPVLAYYYSTDEKLLVYDHASGGSLSSLLHGKKFHGRSLNWESRVKISLGAARGVAHIHSVGKSTHGNIKSSNVLLTRDFTARITDFGLIPLMGAPLVPSHGYRAPEIVATGKPTQKSDAYSFGVLLLELLTGKEPEIQVVGQEGLDLPRWVQSFVREEWMAEVFDADLNEYQDEMVRLLQVAMACVAGVPERRPAMDEIVKTIEEIRVPNSEIGRN